MLLGHNVITDRETETCALPGWFRCKERLEQPVSNIRGYANTIIPDTDLNGFTKVPC